MQSYSSYQGIYFHVHSAPVEDADQCGEARMLVPVASRHGGEGMLGWLGWAGVPSVGAKPWSGRAAARALVGLVCIRQIQGVAVKGQSQKVTNGGLSVSATLLSPCALLLNLNVMIR